MADKMEVRLVQHTATELQQTPVGEEEVTVKFDKYNVYVHSEALIVRNKDKKLLVGYIGMEPTRRGPPKFTPIPTINEFTYAQQDWITEEVYRLHPHPHPAKPRHPAIPPPEAAIPDEPPANDDAEVTEE
jgi:hypothetical protein